MKTIVSIRGHNEHLWKMGLNIEHMPKYPYVNIGIKVFDADTITCKRSGSKITPQILMISRCNMGWQSKRSKRLFAKLS